MKGLKQVLVVSLPKEPQGCVPPDAGEHPPDVQDNPRGPGLSPRALCCPKNWVRSSRTLPSPPGGRPLPAPSCPPAAFLAAAVTSSL